MLTKLFIDLVECGIIQFGHFQAEVYPSIKTQFNLLSSYPELLERLSQQLKEKVDPDTDKLVAAQDVLPLGFSVGSMLKRPLIYQLPLYGQWSKDLIGAYDVGHKSSLILGMNNHLTGNLIKGCEMVGLDITEVLCILDDGKSQLPEGVILKSLMTLDAALALWKENHYLPANYSL
ncbi:hypothetical protein MASR2M15_02610 [Anaerolineales bacterium]